MLSRNAIHNIQTALVIAGAIAAWIFIPDDILRPVAWATLAIGAAVSLGIREYLKKLHSESRLSGEDQFFYTEVAIAFALLGLVAFIVLIVEYS